MLRNPNTQINCEKCLDGYYSYCIQGKCIHGSIVKSVIGAMEAYFWKAMGVYRNIDTIICCSDFMKKELSANPQLKDKLETLHNFIDINTGSVTNLIDGDYVLYFGRYLEEKGIKTLLKVACMLPEVKFVFAGKGSLEDEISSIDNIENVGFKKGDALDTLIKNALFSVCTSEWYENCPFSVIESMALGTPVLGANIGGIPELIQEGKTDELFESGNAEVLKTSILKLWGNKALAEQYSRNCRNAGFYNLKAYAEKLIQIYGKG